MGSDIFAVAMDSRVLISKKSEGGSVQQHGGPFQVFSHSPGPPGENLRFLSIAIASVRS